MTMADLSLITRAFRYGNENCVQETLWRKTT